MTARRRFKASDYALQRPVFHLTVIWLPKEADGGYDFNGAIAHMHDTAGVRKFRKPIARDTAALCYSARTKEQARTEGDGWWIALLPDDVDTGLLAHEAVHIANRAFKNNGWQHGLKNDEHFASTVQAVVTLFEDARPA